MTGQKLDWMIGAIDELIRRDKEWGLRPHQSKAAQKWREHMADTSLDPAQRQRGYVRMPTQTGKMFLFTRAIAAMRKIAPNQQIMIGFPFNALFDQAEESLADAGINPKKDIGYIYGEVSDKQSELDKPIVMGIYNSIVNGVRNHEASAGKFRIDPRQFILLPDETHRAMSELRQDALRQFDMAYGFTATPDFGVRKRLTDLLGTEMYRLNLRDAIRQGALAAGVRNRLLHIEQGGIDLSDIRIIGDNYDEGDLQEKLTNTILSKAIGDHYERHHQGQHGFVHLAGRDHVDWFVDQANARFGKSMPPGVEFAVAFHGRVVKEREDRKRILERFKAGKIRMLCDVRMARESVSISSARFVYNAVPTMSWVDAEQRARCIGLDTSHPTAIKHVYDLFYPGMRMINPILYAQIMGSAELYQAGYGYHSSTQSEARPPAEPEGKGNIQIQVPSSYRLIYKSDEIMRYARVDGKELRRVSREFPGLPQSDHPNGYLSAKEWSEWIVPFLDEKDRATLENIVDSIGMGLSRAKKLRQLSPDQYRKKLVEARKEYAEAKQAAKNLAPEPPSYLDNIETYRELLSSPPKGQEKTAVRHSLEAATEILAQQKRDFGAFHAAQERLIAAEQNLFVWRYGYLRMRWMRDHVQGVLEPNPRSLVSRHKGKTYLSPLLRYAVSQAVENYRAKNKKDGFPHLFSRYVAFKPKGWIWVDGNVLSCLKQLGWQSDRLVLDMTLQSSPMLHRDVHADAKILAQQPDLPPLPQWCQYMMPHTDWDRQGIPALAINPLVYPDLAIRLQHRGPALAIAQRFDMSYVPQPENGKVAPPDFIEVEGIKPPITAHPRGFLNRNQFAFYLGLLPHHPAFNRLWTDFETACRCFCEQSWWNDGTASDQKVADAMAACPPADGRTIFHSFRGPHYRDIVRDWNKFDVYHEYGIVKFDMNLQDQMEIWNGEFFLNPVRRYWMQEQLDLVPDFPAKPANWLGTWEDDIHPVFRASMRTALGIKTDKDIYLRSAIQNIIFGNGQTTTLVGVTEKEPVLKTDLFRPARRYSDRFSTPGYAINLKAIPGMMLLLYPHVASNSELYALLHGEDKSEPVHRKSSALSGRQIVHFRLDEAARLHVTLSKQKSR